MAKREDVIREVQTLLPDRMSGYQVAKSVVLLASAPAGTVKQVGPKCRGVAEAERRIAIVDEEYVPASREKEMGG